MGRSKWSDGSAITRRTRRVRYRRARWVSCFASLVFATSVGAEVNDEDTILELEERIGSVEQLVGNIQVGAWADFVFRDSNLTGQDPFFDPHHLYTYLDARVSDEWSGFAEIEYEHSVQLEGGDEVEGSGEIKLERLYIQYSGCDCLNLRFGKFATRSGYWTPIHWAILMDTIQKPIHEDNGYVPKKQVGIEAFGDVLDTYIADLPVSLELAGWISNGSEVFGTNNPQDGRFGYGGDLRIVLDDRYLLGSSFYEQENPGQQGRRERTAVVYVDLQTPFDVTLRAEYLHQQRNQGFDEIDVVYAKARWDFHEQVYLNYRFGVGEDDKRGAGEDHTEHVLTLGYLPHRNVRIRAEWARNDFDAGEVEDFDIWGAYIGLIF